MTPDNATDSTSTTDTETGKVAEDKPATDTSTDTVVDDSKPVEKKTEEPAKKATTLLGEGDSDTSTEDKGDTKKTETKSPDKYDLKLPKDAKIDASAIERTSAFARKLSLSNEAAQGALEFLNQELADRETATLAANRPGGVEWQTRVASWEEEARSDPDIGGSPEKFDKNVALATQVLNKFAPPEFKKVLFETGYGSHPSIIKMFAKIGKATAEGTLVMPGTQDNKTTRDPAEVLFGATSPKE